MARIPPPRDRRELGVAWRARQAKVVRKEHGFKILTDTVEDPRLWDDVQFSMETDLVEATRDATTPGMVFVPGPSRITGLVAQIVDERGRVLAQTSGTFDDLVLEGIDVSRSTG